MEGNRTVRKILLSCVKPTPESIFGDVPDLDITKAILDAKKGVNGRNCGLQTAASLVRNVGDLLSFNDVFCRVSVFLSLEGCEYTTTRIKIEAKQEKSFTKRRKDMYESENNMLRIFINNSTTITPLLLWH